MEYGAIDLHLRRSQFRIVQADGTLVKHGKFDTTRAELTRLFGDRPRLRLLLESSTESEWVAQRLEALGHEVIVADPNYAPMYGARRKVKTDGRDTAALTDACRLGIFRRAHRVLAAQRARRQQLRIRRQLVRMRSGSICLLRAILRQDGWRLPSGAVEGLEARLDRLAVPPRLTAILAPTPNVAGRAQHADCHGERRGRADGQARCESDAAHDRARCRPGGGADLSGCAG